MKKRILQKKGIFIALLMMVCAFSVNAQTWTAPALTGSVPTTGTTYYVYNVGSNGYLSRGGNYGTQAVVSAQSRVNASTTVIKWKATNTTGSTWTFQYNLNGTDQAGRYLFCDNTTTGTVFTDNSTNNTWDVQVTDAVNNIYSIQIISTYGGYNASQYLGSALATETTNKGIANPVKYNRASGDSYTQWKFVSQADLDLYNARVLLDKYMTYAKNKGGIDLTSYIATYDAGVTADINTAAGNLLTALGRTDMTSFITNPSFESTFTGWTNGGSFATQTNVPGQGWTKDLTRYCEKYIASGSNLAAGSTITQTVSGLANGLYELVVSGHAVQQAGANPLHTGAYITAGSQSTEVIAGKDYSISNIVIADGTLTIGYSLVAPTACNWTGFDNFHLYYYGPEAGVPAVVASKAAFTFGADTEVLTDSLTVTGANLSGPISISAPAGITVNPTSLAADAVDAKVLVTYDGTTPVSGNISFTSGSTTTNVAVTGAADCFTPLYPTGNLVTNPRCTNLATYRNWGSTAIVSDANAYCGSSVRFTGDGGGSIDYTLTGKLLPNTTYRLKAMMYTTGNGATFLLVGCGIDGSTANKAYEVNTNGTWQSIDTVFTTGTLAAGQFFYYNSSEVYNGVPKNSTDTRMDNFEIYKIPAIYVAEASVPVMSANVGSSDSKTITVHGNSLTAGVSLALSGTDAAQFSVSPSLLSLVDATDSVATTTVTITYTPTVESLSHTATLTLSSPGATDKTFDLLASVPTGLRSTVAGSSATVVGRTLKVKGSESYEVFTAQGLKVAQSGMNNETYSVTLKPGVYIVKLDKGVVKVMVK